MANLLRNECLKLKIGQGLVEEVVDNLKKNHFLTVFNRILVCIVAMRQRESMMAKVKLCSLFSHFLALPCCLRCDNTFLVKG